LIYYSIGLFIVLLFESRHPGGVLIEPDRP
jgi:hypothetical protein